MNDLTSWVRRSPVLWPVPPPYLGVPALLILLVTWGSIRASLEWQALDWTRTSALVGSHTQLTAVVAAGAAALVAVRLTRRSLVFAQPWQVRASTGAPARHLVLVVGWCLGAYLVGLLPLFTVTALRGAGSPKPLPILGALIGFAVLTLLGYVVGAAVQNLVAVPITVGLTFLLTGLPLGGEAWSALTPMASFPPSLGLYENPMLGAYRLGFLLSLGVALVWTLVKLLGEHPFRPAVGHGAAVVAVVVAATLPHLRPFPLVEYTEAAPEVCRTQEGVRYCVHEGHSDSLEQVVRDSARVFAAYGVPEAIPEEVRDYSLANSEGEVAGGHEQGVLWLRIYPGWAPEQTVSDEAAHWVVPGFEGCGSNGVAGLEGAASPEERRAALLYELHGWVLEEARGASQESGLFAGAEPEQVRAWSVAHHERLVSCEVDPEELPWAP